MCQGQEALPRLQSRTTFPPLLGLWASVSPAAEWGCSAQLGGGGELVCACPRVKGLALGNGWIISPRPSPPSQTQVSSACRVQTSRMPGQAAPSGQAGEPRSVLCVPR